MITSKGLPRSRRSLAALRTLARDARSASTRSSDGLPVSASARRAFARSRAVPTTVAPCATSERAVSTPSPAETPVTSTRLPERSTPSRTSSAVDSYPKVFAIYILPVEKPTIRHADKKGQLEAQSYRWIVNSLGLPHPPGAGLFFF